VNGRFIRETFDDDNQSHSSRRLTINHVLNYTETHTDRQTYRQTYKRVGDVARDAASLAA